jgi:hypothetical protein
MSFTRISHAMQQSLSQVDNVLNLICYREKLDKSIMKKVIVSIIPQQCLAHSSLLVIRGSDLLD